ncbi:PAAR domain-containing protein [uncultured Massilia sp.]|uniref:PAAR domain-containing protein n=1 Tax=uncultured Massilia sp. TaxID=169973 RepID=UPI0025EE369B|nr:PAAR domain-containing protein [uncultured Massilia sp.]
MRKRCYITLGAGTDAGGKVVTASSTMTLDGVPRALEGDLVACAACGQEGRIACAGARLAVSENGRRPALEDDLCQCACQPAPRLLAIQERWRQWVTDDAA